MANSPAEPATRATGRRPVQWFALIAGLVFLVVGVLGFLPGITPGDLHAAGPHSAAEVFGVFQVSVLHNLVHLAFGIGGLLASWFRPVARAYLMISGALYLILWIYGVALDDESPANFIPLNTADNWLHLGLGLGLVALGALGTAMERTKGEYPEPDKQGQ